MRESERRAKLRPASRGAMRQGSNRVQTGLVNEDDTREAERANQRVCSLAYNMTHPATFTSHSLRTDYTAYRTTYHRTTHLKADSTIKSISPSLHLLPSSIQRVCYSRFAALRSSASQR